MNSSADEDLSTFENYLFPGSDSQETDQSDVLRKAAQTFGDTVRENRSQALDESIEAIDTLMMRFQLSYYQASANTLTTPFSLSVIENDFDLTSDTEQSGSALVILGEIPTRKTDVTWSSYGNTDDQVSPAEETARQAAGDAADENTDDQVSPAEETARQAAGDAADEKPR